MGRKKEGIPPDTSFGGIFVVFPYLELRAERNTGEGHPCALHRAKAYQKHNKSLSKALIYAFDLVWVCFLFIFVMGEV